MTDAIRNHVADLVLRAQGMMPETTRAGLKHADADVRDRHRANLVRANHIADALTPHLLAFRELIEVAEAAGLEGAALDRAREAHAALTGFDNTKPGS